MNRLTLKALLLSVITEMKFGQPLAPNANLAKLEYKKLVGLSRNAPNKMVLSYLQYTFEDNGLKDDFDRTIAKFGAEKYLTKLTTVDHA